MRGRAITLVAICAPALGLLAGCPTVDLGDTPEDVGLCNPAKGETYFETMIWPTYLNGAGKKQCTQAACHDPSGQSALRFEVSMPIDYQTNYKATQIYLNCSTPDTSELLTKPLAGTTSHGGGDLFTDDSDPAVQVFLDWFTP
nr:hypothetical protein [Kofleriaceae bacterium]